MADVSENDSKPPFTDTNLLQLATKNVRCYYTCNRTAEARKTKIKTNLNIFTTTTTIPATILYRRVALVGFTIYQRI